MLHGSASLSDLRHNFHPRISVNCAGVCPPHEARAVNQKIYRGIRVPPIRENDFSSHAEMNAPSANLQDCTHWGLSVWVNEKAVYHARKTYRSLRKWHIAEGTVSEADGVLLATPSDKQPEHFTYWKAFGREISNLFKVVMAPSNA